MRNVAPIWSEPRVACSESLASDENASVSWIPDLLARRKRNSVASAGALRYVARPMASASDLTDNLTAPFSSARVEMAAQGTPAKENGSLWLDRLGIALSVLCAVHCALTPVLVAVAPLLFTAEFEGRTKVALVALASVALIVGFVSHRSFKPIYWLGLALGLLGLSHYWETVDLALRGAHDSGGFHVGEVFEIATTVLASGALIMAHLANSRACSTRAPHGH